MINKIRVKIEEKGFLFAFLFIILSSFSEIIFFVVRRLLSLFKLQNIFVFYSLPDFSDNSKELYNYYLNNPKYNNYKFVWLVSSPQKFNNIKYNRTIFVKDKSKLHSGRTLKAVIYLSLAKVMFYTHSSPLSSLKKYRREGQLIINLWHGCGYKNIEEKTLSRRKEILFDYVLVPGKVFIETKSKFFRCSKEQILDIGYPRYDLLLKDSEVTSNYITKLLNKNKKIILWMPTFRKTVNSYYPEEQIAKEFDLPLLNSKEEMIELNNICKNNEVVLCIKRHPMQVEYECEKEKYSNIIFIDNTTLTDNDVELYSLLKYTSGLITDYSSVAIDYLLIDKPIAFTLADFDAYSKTRGFVFDDPKKYMPGNHIYNFEDMKNYIVEVGNNVDKYGKERKNIMKEVHNKCDNYCERISNKVEEIMRCK